MCPKNNKENGSHWTQEDIHKNIWKYIVILTIFGIIFYVNVANLFMWING